MKKTAAEQIQELDKKIEQLENRRKLLANQAKQQERKARTRRLVQYGALAEKYLGYTASDNEPGDFEKFLKQFVGHEGVKAALASMREKP